MRDLVSQDCNIKRGECFVLLAELGKLCCVGNLVPYEPVHGYEQPQKRRNIQEENRHLGSKEINKMKSETVF